MNHALKVLLIFLLIFLLLLAGWVFTALKIGSFAGRDSVEKTGKKCVENGNARDQQK